MRDTVFLFVIFSFLISCRTEVKPKEPFSGVVAKSDLSKTKKHTPIRYIVTDAKEQLKGWKEYSDIKAFIVRFERASANKILSNALELKEKTTLLKDSIRIELLKTPAFKARLNVFENEALRLADMNTILAITPEEVHKQNEKILIVYNSIVDKINVVFEQKKLEEEIDLDDFVIGLDSTAIDTLQKNIQNEFKNEFKTD